MPNLINGLTFRQIFEAEADILTAIHAECFPHYLNQQAFNDFFNVRNTYAFLAEEGGLPAAMMVYRTAFEQADLITIAVLPKYRRRGIASFFVEKLIADCKAQGVDKIFLEVEVGNDNAVKIYEDSGFKQIDRRKLYYQQRDGSLTDSLVMEKKI